MKKEKFEIYTPLHLQQLRFAIEKEIKRQNSSSQKVLRKVSKILKSKG